MDFTLSNARRFHSSMGNPLGRKGLNIFRITYTMMSFGTKNLKRLQNCILEIKFDVTKQGVTLSKLHERTQWHNESHIYLMIFQFRYFVEWFSFIEHFLIFFRGESKEVPFGKILNWTYIQFQRLTVLFVQNRLSGWVCAT